ncbi:MAG: MBL fold metallo-hydrolase [Anaerolineae bacterium]|nr:MBL fold metallo-hydrolase [Anaerolineae bacterium]
MRTLIKTLIFAFALILTLIVVQMGRQALAASEVERAWGATVVQRAPNLGTTKSLTIVPLVDEAASRPDLQFEHGVAYLIKTDRHTVLMDLGWNNGATPLRHNMESLAVPPTDIEALAFSHVHPDHVGGFNWWVKDTFALGAEQTDLHGLPVYTPAPLTYPGLTAILTAQPTVMTEAIATTGGIAFAEVFPLSLWRTVRTEQAVAVNVEGKGIVLILGCGHPTLERIVARAQAAFDAPVVGVVGGLHYEDKSPQVVSASIAYVKTLQPQLVALSPHDSTSANIQAFRDAFPTSYQNVEVGRPITLRP